MGATNGTMRVMEARSPNIQDLRIAEHPIPQPGSGEVLIRVRAASLNYRDLVVLKGIYKKDITYPFVPLSDACGEVVALGEAVTQGGTASRETGFSVTLMGSATRTQGVILCDQTRTVDARARAFRRLEKAPDHVVQEALDAVRSILE